MHKFKLHILEVATVNTTVRERERDLQSTREKAEIDQVRKMGMNKFYF